MRVIGKKVYKFNELNETLKDSAIESLGHIDYPWNDENKATLDGFVDIFLIKVKLLKSKKGLIIRSQNSCTI